MPRLHLVFGGGMKFNLGPPARSWSCRILGMRPIACGDRGKTVVVKLGESGVLNARGSSSASRLRNTCPRDMKGTFIAHTETKGACPVLPACLYVLHDHSLAFLMRPLQPHECSDTVSLASRHRTLETLSYLDSRLEVCVCVCVCEMQLLHINPSRDRATTHEGSACSFV
jgi:hypothetical protein